MRNDGFDKINAVFPVSHETVDRLKIYQSLLLKWQPKINLVSNSTIDDSWNRHFIDSIQVAKFISSNNTILDVGSGAGFPGMVLAINGYNNVTMVESDQRKCIFLREVSRETKTKVIIQNDRIEKLNQNYFDVITSRACANVSQLFSWVEKFVSHGTKCLFHKGKNYSIELDDAKKEWEFSYIIHPSVIEEGSVILEISDLKRRGL